MKLNRASFLSAVALVSALTLISPALAGGQNQGGNQQGQNGGNRGAPAPLIGASLPGLAIGIGVFWLIRRRLRVVHKRPQ